jgi:hypothetical protein
MAMSVEDLVDWPSKFPPEVYDHVQIESRYDYA